MKAIKLIGIGKSFSYFLYTIAMAFNKVLLFPPLKRWFLIDLGAKIGKNSIINSIKFINCYIYKGLKGLTIGKNCYIGDEVILDLARELKIGDNVTISAGTIILTHSNVGYPSHPLQKLFPAKYKKTIIESGCFIGANSIILCGTMIGKNSYIGANSLVTKNIPKNSLAFGSPAKVIKKLKL
jgi:acetyltransferase-like isoleucine patch superfamily enzyme